MRWWELLLMIALGLLIFRLVTGCGMMEFDEQYDQEVQVEVPKEDE